MLMNILPAHKLFIIYILLALGKVSQYEKTSFNFNNAIDKPLWLRTDV